MSATPGVVLIKECAGMVLIPLVLMLYSSPVLAVRDIMQRKTTGKYEFVPYLLMFANCFVWTTFCVIRGVEVMYEPFIVNCYGLVVTVIALLVYAKYITEDAVRASYIKKVPLVVSVLVVLAVIAFSSGTNECTDPSSLKCWWGKLCIVINSALFVGPFVTFREAWLSKSVEFMPLASLVSGMIASSDCSVYFFCLSDINGLIPNVAGVVLSAVQIGFYAYLVRNYPQTPVELQKKLSKEEPDAWNSWNSSRQTSFDSFRPAPASRQITPYTLVKFEPSQLGSGLLTEPFLGA